MGRHAKKSIARFRFTNPKPHPPVDFAMLCQLLELEILLGQTRAFRLRLKRALSDVQEQALQEQIAQTRPQD